MVRRDQDAGQIDDPFDAAVRDAAVRDEVDSIPKMVIVPDFNDGHKPTTRQNPRARPEAAEYR